MCFSIWNVEDPNHSPNSSSIGAYPFTLLTLLLAQRGLQTVFSRPRNITLYFSPSWHWWSANIYCQVTHLFKTVRCQTSWSQCRTFYPRNKQAHNTHKTKFKSEPLNEYIDISNNAHFCVLNTLKYFMWKLQIISLADRLFCYKIL